MKTEEILCRCFFLLVIGGGDGGGTGSLTLGIEPAIPNLLLVHCYTELRLLCFVGVSKMLFILKIFLECLSPTRFDQSENCPFCFIMLKKMLF